MMIGTTVYAAGNNPTISGIVDKISEHILNPLILLMFALATVMFLWGVFQFLVNSDDSEARDTGRRHILWGVIGMFIMVSVYAIIRIALTTVSIPVPPGLQ
jgi:hypothetical protein